MTERDHEFRECAETREVKPGMYTVDTCEACRIEAYSLETREPADERPTPWQRFKRELHVLWDYLAGDSNE